MSQKYLIHSNNIIKRSLKASLYFFITFNEHFKNDYIRKGLIMGLLDEINKQRKTDKKVDNKVVTEISYPTGFSPLDYANGVQVTAYDDYDMPIETNDMLGIVGGSKVTIIGISGTGKSALAIEIAGSCIHMFKDNSCVQHADIEGATSMQRPMKILRLPPSLLKKTYELFHDKAAEDIVDLFKTHCLIKLENKNKYTYNTGVRNLYGDIIYELYPSASIIDSFAMFKSKDIDLGVKEVKDITNNMMAARSAQFNKGILSQMISYGKKANVSIITVNHINANVNTSFIPKPSQHMYLSQDESIPGGTASLYLANNIIKLKLLKKYITDKPETMEYGIPGFLVDARFIKSRTNSANVPVELVFDHRSGRFSKTLTLLHYAVKHELLQGSSRSLYLPGLPSSKFTKKTFEDTVKKSPDILLALYEACLPKLQSMLSTDYGKFSEESSKEKYDAMYMALEEHQRDVEGYKKQGWLDF